MSAGQEHFGALPVRAFSDDRLTAINSRVLGVIAYHDRLGRNGMGCTVGAEKMAERAKVNPAHLSRHTKKLEDLGYILIERSAADKRRQLSVVQDVDQKRTTAMGRATARQRSGQWRPDVDAPGDQMTTSGQEEAFRVASLNGGNQSKLPPFAECAPQKCS